MPPTVPDPQSPLCRVLATSHTPLYQFDLGSPITIKQKLTLALEQSRGQDGWWQGQGRCWQLLSWRPLAEDDLWSRPPSPPPQLPEQPHRESQLPFWISHNPTFSLCISVIFQQVLNAHLILLRSNQDQQPGERRVLEIRQGYLVEKKNTSQRLLGVSSHRNLVMALFRGPQCTAQDTREFSSISSSAPRTTCPS